MIQDNIYEPISDEDVDLKSNLYFNHEYEDIHEISSDHGLSQRQVPPFEPLMKMVNPLPKPLIEETPRVELNSLPKHLKYTHLGPAKIMPVASDLNPK